MLILLLVIIFASSLEALPKIKLIRRKFVFADSGLISLVDKDFSSNVYALYGQWEFYWNQLLTPAQISALSNKKNYVQVPANWTSYKLNGQNLPSFGYATYKLKVVVPDTIKTLTISFHGIFTAYNLWINGEFIDQNGRVDTNANNFTPTWLPKNYIVPVNDTLEIVMQIANFAHFKGGILRQVIIGAPQVVYKYSMLGIAYEAGLIGAMIIMAFYFLFFFYYQKLNISSLYLALVLISQAFITGLDGEYIIFRFFPNLNWYFGLHLLYVLFYYRSILFLHYVYHLMPKELNFKIVIHVTAIYFIMTLYVIFMPIKTFGFALIFFILASILLGIYIIVSLFKLIKYQIGALYTLLGLIILLLAGINDALYDFRIVHTFYMSGLGFLIFVFVLSMTIAMSNARTQSKILAYSIILRKLNNLREELIRIPFYDLGQVLSSLIKIANFSRGLWIDKIDNQLLVKYENYLNKTKSINKDIDELPDNFAFKHGIKYVQEKKKIYWYSLTKKERRKGKRRPHKLKSQVVKYLIQKKFISLYISPIIRSNQLLSILYMENQFKPLNPIQKRLLLSFSPQLAALKTNADSYKQLQQINQRLEKMVQQRTVELKEKEQQLYLRELELKEKIEELKAYNEQINRIHRELEKSKEEIEQQNYELEKLHTEIYQQKRLVENQNKELTEKIKFAKKIQDLILKLDTNLPFADLFILYLPKHIVSGDFYWIRRYGKKIIIAVADCTGHGVPGAFMSILGSAFLTEIINRYYQLDPQLNISTGKILDDLRQLVINTLAQSEQADAQVKDGMDIALIIIDEDTLEAKFSGAYLPLWIIRNGNLLEYKATRQPIGPYYKENITKPFATHYIKLEKGDMIYMFSDGYIDQFNPSGTKFYRKNFKRLLLQIYDHPCAIQKDLLQNVFDEWKNSHFQVDDVLVIGISV